MSPGLFDGPQLNRFRTRKTFWRNSDSNKGRTSSSKIQIWYVSAIVRPAPNSIAANCCYAFDPWLQALYISESSSDVSTLADKYRFGDFVQRPLGRTRSIHFWSHVGNRMLLRFRGREVRRQQFGKHREHYHYSSYAKQLMCYFTVFLHVGRRLCWYVSRIYLAEHTRVTVDLSCDDVQWDRVVDLQRQEEGWGKLSPISMFLEQESHVLSTDALLRGKFT